MTIDPTSKAILQVIADNGYSVNATTTEVTATDQKTGERFIIRHEDSLYAACVELAQQVGIDLMDG